MKNWTTLEPDRVKLMNKHFTPGRGGNKIECVVIHHNAGVLSIDQIWNVWQTRKASAHYQVTSSGEIGQLVWDRDTAWHAANQYTNQRSIGIEISNSGGANQDWPVSGLAIREAGRLVAAICRYYKLGRPVSGNNVRYHREFTGTSCPYHLAPGGKYNAALMAEAQRFYDELGGSTPTTPSKEDDMALFGPDQVGALHEAKVNSAAANQKIDQLIQTIDTLGKRVKLIEDQLIGPEQDQWPVDKRNPNGGRGWPQLGTNARGQWLTLVDFLSTRFKKGAN